MTPLFGINIAKKSLLSHAFALNVTGHNIANCNTEGFSRQRVEFTTTEPQFYVSVRTPKVPGQIGTGTKIMAIKRVFDMHVEQRIRWEKQRLGYWSSVADKLYRVELVLNEPTETNIRSLFDAFIKSLKDLSNDPEMMAERVTVQERATAFADAVSYAYRQLYELQRVVNDEVREFVVKINALAKEIAYLNKRITASLAKRENPNDLLDRRDTLILELAQIVDIQVVYREPEDFKITVGGLALVQGHLYYELETHPVKDRLLGIFWKERKEEVVLKGGKLSGLMRIRDEEIPLYLAMLDELAVVLVDRFNEVHRMGFCLDGTAGADFFVPFREKEEGIYKVVGAAYVYDTQNPLGAQINDDYVNPYFYPPYKTPQTSLKDEGQIEINGYTIPYHAKEDSLEEIVERINDADCGVVAYINPANRLALYATREYNYTIRSLRDKKGNLLQVLGILKEDASYPPDTSLADGAQIVRPPYAGAASTLSVHQSIVQNPEKIAAASGVDTSSPLDGVPDESFGPGDGRNAASLAALGFEPLFNAARTNFSDFFAALISEVGVASSVAKRAEECQKLYLENLEHLKDSISGVSLDEEMINLVRYQHGYNAAARLVALFDRVLAATVRLGE